MDQLAAVAALPDQKAKTEQYRAILQSLLAAGDVEELKCYVDHSEPQPPPPVAHLRSLAPPLPCDTPLSPLVVTDDVPLVVSRAMLSTFAQSIKNLQTEAHKAIATQ